MKWFKKNDFNFISVDELYDIYLHQKPIPPSTVIFTVDDGWKENKENITEVAEKYQIPVAIFINTDPIENGGGYWVSYLNATRRQKQTNHQLAEIKKLTDCERKAIVEELKSKVHLEREALTVDQLLLINQNQYVTLGAHTVTHPFLTKCSDEEAHHEINLSKDKLNNWLQKNIDTFAYPFGNYGQREIALLKQSGYKMAFSTKADYISKDNINAIYELPRFEVLEHVSPMENICRMTGVWDKTLNQLKNKN